MNPVAVTGASGLLGRHVIDKLLEEQVPVIALVRDTRTSFPAGVSVRHIDMTDPTSMHEAFEGAGTIVHAAGFVSFNPRRRKEIMEINVEGTRHVVNVCLDLGIKNIVQISSVSALGRKPGEMVNEDDPWTGLHASDYGTSKYLAELEIYRGAEEGMNVGLVNPSVILTGSQPHRSSASILDYVWNGNRFVTGGFLNYVDARDVSDAVFALIKTPRNGERFILSGGRIAFEDFFRRVAKVWNKRAPSIHISPAMASMFGWAEEVRSFLTGSEPMVTRQSARMTILEYEYDTTRSKTILGMRYRELDETIAWCCAAYAQNVTANKP